VFAAERRLIVFIDFGRKGRFRMVAKTGRHVGKNIDVAWQRHVAGIDKGPGGGSI
jgi:hypothetical protein